MTLLSVVMPVHKVQGYLRQCLDSVLDQSFTDFEIVAVDDASPDHSGAILDEYAARDPRVKVVRPPANVGVGEARNLGLDHATGEFVWFVDADDWLTPGSLRAVAERLAGTGADVLVVGWDRSYWTGEVTPGTAAKLLAEAPESFRLDEWPRIVDVLHVCWNKIVRRELLLRMGYRFESGWYEDLGFTYGVFAAADKISTLARDCVKYRQRRSGAATRTVGDKHFEIFGHWDRTYEIVAEHTPHADALRPHLFRRMVWHHLTVLRHGERVPPKSRKRFFTSMTEQYRRHVPPGGYPVPGGAQGVRHRLVGRGAYRTFQAFNTFVKTAKWGKRQLRGGKRLAKRGALNARALLLRGYYRWQLTRPIDQNLALYSAYWFRGVTCNPGAIYARAKELAPGVRGVWVVNRARAAAMPKGVPYVVAGTPAYFRALARARYLINNVNWPNDAVKRPGTTHVMTHHGTPLKKMGLHQADHPAGATDKGFEAQMRRADRWDFSVTSNAHTTIAWDGAYPCRYETLEVGYPRNDRLALAGPEEGAAVRERLGIAPGETVVLYAPTHREWLPPGTPLMDVEDFAAKLGPGHVLLVRAHYFHVPPGGGGEFPRAGNVIDVSAYPVVEDLYLAADSLVTDYSSLMFDYGVLDRPIVIFAPDWDAYRALRGVYFDLTAEPPGIVATTYADLVDAYTSGAYAGDTAAKARAHFRSRFCYLDDGGAAERVVRRVMLGLTEGDRA
ncbi:bifunctional glycosyltransferase/CDP-glycerol:glycerophosphate glycerophosphotransferase [Spirilliplanes yamanashiensis]|uniref:Glycosyl transferase n=1 Tax=Spirilliplanes yamanashiensis TaxID=42233 RepID=A0A8J3Y9K4_9ACTN|nr:bifunctional glycosyltransferase family 2 protein/CDP-glycerol:glycerophosphate glycerophosphotransferase [Spirilliplanes yamanashiensis]MDP9815558.1 CDP-glycerol glycerophosphotransferase [Spirilliplanes yamanashiensis]GIJ03812.1 glycosyl transferase [Spirilliplanes yamanashiensis]